VGGVCIVLKLEIIFGKLLGIIEYEFLRHLKYLDRDRGARKNQKKRLVEAEASPSFLVSIHRSLVPPTALAMPNPTELRHTPTELSHTPLSYATPQLSYAKPHWAMPHPN
jgi:hypothetical protein